MGADDLVEDWLECCEDATGVFVTEHADNADEAAEGKVPADGFGECLCAVGVVGCVNKDGGCGTDALESAR